MKTRFFYSIISALLIIFGTAACNDNLNDELEPEKTDLTLTVNGVMTDSIDFRAWPSHDTVKVASNTRWIVEVKDCEGGWCSVDVVNDKGNGSFVISVTDNMRQDRQCYVYVYRTNVWGEKVNDGSCYIKVRQESSRVRLTPGEVEPFEPVVGERTQDFVVDSNEPWTLDVSYDPGNQYDFVTVIPITGMTPTDNGYKGDGSASFRIKLDDNRTAAGRRAYLTLRSATSVYIAEIYQQGTETPFDVSPTENQLISAEGGTKTFKIYSTEGWNISTADEDWISFSKQSSEGGSLSIVETVATIAPNISSSPRTGIIWFEPKNDKYPKVRVNVEQLGCDFSVSPLEYQTVAAEGGTVKFNVTSIDGWRVEADDWVSFTVPSHNNSGSVERNETEAIISPNTFGRERSTVIRFIPKSNKYPTVNINLVQKGYDLTFAISSQDGSRVVMQEGGSVEFDLDSRFNWYVLTPDWIHATPNTGENSINSRKIRLTVDANLTNDNRTMAVTVYPERTEFAGGIYLDPEILGIGPMKLHVTQFGGSEPAVSVPWVLDGYGQTYATVQCNYYSPYYDVESCGLEWKAEDASEWNDVPCAVVDPKQGVISADLTALKAATRYVVRGYVRYGDGKVKVGSAQGIFLTAGVRPGQYDNDTPGVNGQ